MATLNMLDIAKLSGNDKSVGLVEEYLPVFPELKAFPARSINGTSYDTLKRVAWPTVGFTAAGTAGSTPTTSRFAKVKQELFCLQGSVVIPKSIAQAYDQGVASLQAIESGGVALAAMQWIGKQIFYGTSNDSLGFPGLKNFVPYGSDISVSAGGGTDDIASSVYFVKFGTQQAELLFGNNSVLDLGPFREQLLTDPSASTKVYDAWVAAMTTWCGLQITNVNCVGRIMNLTTDSGKTLSDSLMNQLLWKFPVGFMPDAIFMARRSAQQLQNSRTVTIQTGGSSKIAPNIPAIPTWTSGVPTDFMGIPIYVTDSIGITDKLES